MNEISVGNCVDLMKMMKDDSVEMSFADPPFNLKKRYNAYNDKQDTQNYIQWCQTWLEEMVRVTRGSIFVHNIPKWLVHCAGFLNTKAAFKHWITWDAPSAPMGSSLQPAHYGILYYTKTPKFYELRCPHKRCRECGVLLKDYGGKKSTLHPFGPLVSDVWADIHRIKHNKYRDKHPCQLPIHLLERILLMSTDENDMILDPFIGTGTTAIAAKRLGRQYIGFDISKKYKDIAEFKLVQEKVPSKIGQFWVSTFPGDKLVTVRDIDTKNPEFQAHFHWPQNPEETKKINWTELASI